MLGAFVGPPRVGTEHLEEYWDVTQAAWEKLGLADALTKAVRGAAGEVRARRVRDTFDALKTQRFLHLLRDARFSDVSLLQALSQTPGLDAKLAAETSLGQPGLELVRDWFVDHENAAALIPAAVF